MSEQDQEPHEESPSVDPLVEAQQGKGYGEDEGERDASLEDEQ